MSSEARLYTFSDPTKKALQQFRLGTSRSNDPQAVIYYINKEKLEICQEKPIVYSNLEDLDEALGASPRYILLSYPLKLGDRISVPYVMLYYLPETCNNEARMLYAGAKELMRNTAGAARIIEIDDNEGLQGLEDKLKGESA